ncbi:MAG: HAMP domain-containing protein [Chlorobia bacterium]|nr:HAMP domain-containing protein [Fimbriimonadaceae bacterium]
MAIVFVMLGAVLYVVSGLIRARSLDTELQQKAKVYARRWPLPPDRRNRPPRQLAPPMTSAEAEREGLDLGLIRRAEVQQLLAGARVLDMTGRSIVYTDQGALIPEHIRSDLNVNGIYGNTKVQGYDVRVFTYPIQENGKTVAALQYGALLEALKSDQADLLRVMLLMIPVALGVTTLLGFVLARRALKPIAELGDDIARIEADNLSKRLHVTGHDEFAKLSTRFNGLLERLDLAFKKQKQFVADASHELKTPLTVIRTRSDLGLRAERTPEQYKEHLQAIGRAAHSMTQIASDMLLLAQADENQLEIAREKVELKEVLMEAVDLSPATAKEKVNLETVNGAVIYGDRSKLVRLFRNLIENADRHTQPDGHIQITASKGPSSVSISLKDDGSGIAPEHLDRLFDRFYRVDRARDRQQGGSGLGLAISKSIVEAHRGTIKIASEIGKGTSVQIDLPIA